MELQVSHRICTKVSETSNIREIKRRYRTNHTKVMRMERRRDYRSRSLSGSYPYVSVDTAQNQRIEFMGYLKGKSSLMIFDKHANMKYRYGNREFWCRGYYVDTVGKNKKAIQEYIRNQLQEDLAYEQMSIKELVDPFTGQPVNASKK